MEYERWEDEYKRRDTGDLSKYMSRLAVAKSLWTLPVDAGDHACAEHNMVRTLNVVDDLTVAGPLGRRHLDSGRRWRRRRRRRMRARIWRH